MNVTPKGEAKVVVSQEYAATNFTWPTLLVELYVGALAWSVILHRLDWANWLLSWLPWL